MSLAGVFQGHLYIVWLINYSNRCACLCKSVYLRSHEIQSRPLHKCIITHTHTHTLTLSGTAMILPASLSAPRSLMALLLSRVLTPFFLSISPLIEYKNSCRCGFLPTERVDWNAVILIMCLWFWSVPVILCISACVSLCLGNCSP